MRNYEKSEPLAAVSPRGMKFGTQIGHDEMHKKAS